MPRATLVVAAVGEADEVAAIVVATAVRLVSGLPDARLHLVHVVDVLPGAEVAIRDNAWKHPGAAALRTTAERRLEQWAAVAERSLQRRPEVHLEFGPPGVRIVELATRLKPDFLVVGPLDKAIWQRLAFGSSAEHVLRKAPCTVVLARPTQRDP